jgi:hypothetical protein
VLFLHAFNLANAPGRQKETPSNDQDGVTVSVFLFSLYGCASGHTLPRATVLSETSRLALRDFAKAPDAVLIDSAAELAFKERVRAADSTPPR